MASASPCPDRPRCTNSCESARNVGFPSRELRDLQVRVRTEQQTPDWKARYAVRSGVEGTINEFAHGHGMRHCRYRGQPKAHLQHVLTAIAVNIERLSGRPPTEETPLTETADRLPDLSGPARHPSVEVLANPRQLTSSPRSPTESSSGHPYPQHRPVVTGGPWLADGCFADFDPGVCPERLGAYARAPGGLRSGHPAQQDGGQGPRQAALTRAQGADGDHRVTGTLRILGAARRAPRASSARILQMRRGEVRASSRAAITAVCPAILRRSGSFLRSGIARGMLMSCVLFSRLVTVLGIVAWRVRRVRDSLTGQPSPLPARRASARSCRRAPGRTRPRPLGDTYGCLLGAGAVQQFLGDGGTSAVELEVAAGALVEQHHAVVSGDGGDIGAQGQGHVAFLVRLRSVGARPGALRCT